LISSEAKHLPCLLVTCMSSSLSHLNGAFDHIPLRCSQCSVEMLISYSFVSYTNLQISFH
jgi:hypothetical protein